MTKVYIATCFLVGVFFTLGHAVGLPTAPTEDFNWGALIGELIANPKAFSASIIGAVVVLILVQMLKNKNVFGGLFKKVPDELQFFIITILGQLYAYLVTVVINKDITGSAFLIGLFSSGGATALFNAFKLAFPKLFKKSLA